MTDTLDIYRMEEGRRWRERGDECPWLDFPPEWEVRMIPPFAGADMRFCVRLRGDTGRGISVYADFDGHLGFFDGPYWEAYPIDGDTGRCALSDGAELIAMITRELNKGKSGET